VRASFAKGGIVAAAVMMMALSAPGGANAAPGLPPPGAICTWGGTAVAPTGTFTISPGLTMIPLATPSKFHVTGELGGACTGTLTYDGQIDASGTCQFTTFEGKAKGIPGVTDFAGIGIGSFGPARLYDKGGNVIASENANINTPENAPHAADCGSPQGFRGGNFSSTIVFLDQHASS